MIDCKSSKSYSDLKCRQTKLRMFLGRIFHTAKAPVSVAEIQAIFKEQNFKVNKTSIYRELKFLTKNFIINEIHTDGVAARYEFNHNNPKSYLICTKCQQITPIEVDKNVLKQELEKISKKNNFAIQRHSLIFFGYCHKCQ